MKKAFHIFLSYKLHHVLFWLVYYIGWVQVYKGFYDRLHDLLWVTLVYAIAHAGLYYTTQYVFIPLLLRKRKIAAFIFSFGGIMIASVFFMFFAIQLILGKEQIRSFGDSVTPILISLGFSNLFMTGILLSVKALMDSFRNQRKEEKKEKERLETELQYLKAQVNPHFLFNTINSVYVLIQKDPQKASETLIKLSDLLRAQLYDFGGKEIGIEEELSYLENFMELEQLRKGKKLHLEYEKSPRLKGFKIAPLMLMPFLENCFKHVSTYSGHQNTIRIKLDYSQNHFQAGFFNTKDEQGQAPYGTPGGIGLKNIKRRLQLLYPGAHTLEIKDRPDSFEVYLKIRIEPQTPHRK